MKDYLEDLKNSFTEWSGESCGEAVPLPGSGSERKYWRLAGKSSTAIGAYHPVREESQAFLAFSRYFHSLGLHVPEIFVSKPDKDIYLLQDLGDTTLFSLLERPEGHLPSPESITLCEAALEELVMFQVKAGAQIDYSVCYPRSSFDRQSLAWDLNYFKYNFLKLEAAFNEQRLEDDFQRLMDFLLEAPADHFMYRDFQSRNIMIKNNTPYFIDYQGGRRGPLQYDPVSLLFQVKADLPFELREKLLDHYLQALKKEISIASDQFMKYYGGFILLRLLQVMGAYGFRGLVQKKPHFITSLPYAMKNVRYYLDSLRLPFELPELSRCLAEVSRQGRFAHIPEEDGKRLTVSIRSFSYKKGLPEDYTSHGGGFIFDCRALPNPGREESLRNLNGKDQVIKDYLLARHEVIGYLTHVSTIVEQSVENYLNRGFSALSVAFGCTGGQHRSVYCAEALASHIRNKYRGVIVILDHRELG